MISNKTLPLLTIDKADSNLERNRQQAIEFIEDCKNLVPLNTDSKNGCVIWKEFKSDFFPMKERPNIYAIYHRKAKSEKWSCKYIGQRKSEGILQRLNTHLNKCHINTGSQRSKVELVIKKGEHIALKFIRIAPETLRVYFEEELIKVNETSNWNLQGRN